MYLLTGDKSTCCGCTACVKICNHGALEMKQDNEGFFYPVKYQSKCTNCGLCEKVCPFAHPQFINYKEPLVLAAYLSDISQRIKSSSGGLFYAIAKEIINTHGIVYGCILSDDFKVKHIRATTLKDVELMRGSKYVQSNLNDIFLSVRKDLKENKLVYFTGTPCQVAGLNSFLLKKYNNLITSDLICHGVPSQKMFDLYISYLKENRKIDIKGYQFRDYAKGNTSEIIKYINKKSNKLKYLKYPFPLSPYLFPFEYSYNFRPSCYNCLFARIPRQGDITLADFWGAKKFFPNLDTTHGVSLILLNTKIAENYFEKIKDELKYEFSDIKNASEKNNNLINSTKKPKIREGIYENIDKYGYNYFVKRYFRPNNYNKLKLKYFIKNLLGEKLIDKMRKK